MNNLLRNFYANEQEQEAVKNFLVEVLKEIAIERAFSGQPVTGIQEANELIIKAFEKLDELYGKIEAPIINNSR